MKQARKIRILSLIFWLFQSISSLGQTTYYKGLYLNDLDKILTNSNKTIKCLTWIKREGIESLVCYDLYTVMGSNLLTEKLVEFMLMAKTDFGVKSFEAVAGEASLLTQEINQFNNKYDSLGIGFSSYNLESEWWVGSVSYGTYEKSIRDIYRFVHDSIKNGVGKVETYIGWFGLCGIPVDTEAMLLVNNADIISVSSYQKEVNIKYTISRIESIAKAAKARNKVQDLIIIFSMERKFMGRYSRKHGYGEIFDNWMRQYEQALEQKSLSKDVENYIRIKGWKIFTYSDARRFRK